MRELLVFALLAIYLCVYVVVSRFLLLMFNAGGGLRFFIVSLSISFLFSTARKRPIKTDCIFVAISQLIN